MCITNSRKRSQMSETLSAHVSQLTLSAPSAQVVVQQLTTTTEANNNNTFTVNVAANGTNMREKPYTITVGETDVTGITRLPNGLRLRNGQTLLFQPKQSVGIQDIVYHMCRRGYQIRQEDLNAVRINKDKLAYVCFPCNLPKNVALNNIQKIVVNEDHDCKDCNKAKLQGINIMLPDGRQVTCHPEASEVAVEKIKEMIRRGYIFDESTPIESIHSSKFRVKYICMPCGTVKSLELKDIIDAQQTGCRKCREHRFHTQMQSHDDTKLYSALAQMGGVQSGERWARTIGGFISSNNRAVSAIGNPLITYPDGRVHLNGSNIHAEGVRIEAFKNAANIVPVTNDHVAPYVRNTSVQSVVVQFQQASPAPQVAANASVVINKVTTPTVVTTSRINTAVTGTQVDSSTQSPAFVGTQIFNTTTLADTLRQKQQASQAAVVSHDSQSATSGVIPDVRAHLVSYGRKRDYTQIAERSTLLTTPNDLYPGVPRQMPTVDSIDEHLGQYMVLVKKKVPFVVTPVLPYLTVFQNGHVFNASTNRFVSLYEKFDNYLCFTANNVKMFLHRVVCIAFMPIAGLRSYQEYHGRQVNHKDGDKHNNCLKNLEWVSAETNMRHAYDMDLNVKKRKMIMYQATGKGELIKMLGEYTSLAEGSRQTGIEEHMVRRSAKEGFVLKVQNTGENKENEPTIFVVWKYKDEQENQAWSDKFRSAPETGKVESRAVATFRVYNKNEDGSKGELAATFTSVKATAAFCKVSEHTLLTMRKRNVNAGAKCAFIVEESHSVEAAVPKPRTEPVVKTVVAKETTQRENVVMPQVLEPTQLPSTTDTTSTTATTGATGAPIRKKPRVTSTAPQRMIHVWNRHSVPGPCGGDFDDYKQEFIGTFSTTKEVADRLKMFRTDVERALGGQRIKKPFIMEYAGETPVEVNP
jgi:hypothetical protein